MESSETTIREQERSFGMMPVLMVAWGGGPLISLFIKDNGNTYAKRHLKTKTLPLEKKKTLEFPRYF